MGHPKKQRKKYDTPFRPWDKTRLDSERKLLKEYGLRRKHELWRAEAILRNFRHRARKLLGSPDEKREKELLNRLQKLGIKCSSLDEVLSININDVLSRRLQTIVHKKGANSALHARQMIIHGHITIMGRKIRYPSYLVPVVEESGITITNMDKKPVISENKELEKAAVEGE